MKHLIKLTLICAAVLAAVTYIFYFPQYYDGEILMYKHELGLGRGLSVAGFVLLLFSVVNIGRVSSSLHSGTMSTILKKDAALTVFMRGGGLLNYQYLPNADVKKRPESEYRHMNAQVSGWAMAIPFIFTLIAFGFSAYYLFFIGK